MGNIRLKATSGSYRSSDKSWLSEDYHWYMNSPMWQRKRDKALEKSGHRCELCWDHRNLEVHHLTYQRFKHESPQDLLVVCPDCHDIVDDIRIENCPDYIEWFSEAYSRFMLAPTGDREVLKKYVDYLLEWGEHPHSLRSEEWWNERGENDPFNET